MTSRGTPLQTFWKPFLKLFWGAFLLLTSLYCLLAFLPYTYAALIKAPPYDWVPWFVQNHGLLYWIALLSAAIAYIPGRGRKILSVLFGLQAGLGIYLVIRHPIANLHNDRFAYFWCLIFLAMLPLVNFVDLWQPSSAETENTDQERSLLEYSTGIFLAGLIAVLWLAAVQIRGYSETHSLSPGLDYVELIAWSLISHIQLVLIIISVLNLVRIGATKTPRPQIAGQVFAALLIFAVLWFAIVRFLENALTFGGLEAQLYAALLSASLTLHGYSIVRPLRQLIKGGTHSSHVKAIGGIIAAGMALGTLILPRWIGGGDWNGIIQHTFALAGWITLGACAYFVRPRFARYSTPAILAVLLISLFSYKVLQVTAIYWGKPLGVTDDEISLALEKYASRDASFELAHHALGNARQESCGDLCRILRQYTNIPDFQSTTEVKLVDTMLPVSGERPNIFIFVIDSMRPDYLGAYNSHVDFTPNLDAFARDSVIVRNAFTQYAGTTLSEPAIWSGAMLLHDHNLSGFDKVNSLQKLASTDGYQMMVSYDTVLRQMFPPSQDMVQIDADTTLWNHFEACSTVRQTEQAIQNRANKNRPILFYAQPMNVHQFAHNDMPRPSAANWQPRPGLNDRISYEIHQVDQCLGQFFAFLKQQGLYEKSIIIVASDHGDATGDFGRYSHSVAIYPEIIRVPLIVHLPSWMQGKFVHDDAHISALTDITPSLYYLLGHRPIEHNPLYGRPLFAMHKEELESYRRKDLFLASDVRAVYGVLADEGRYLYVTYDSPAQSMLFDLVRDPNAEHNILTPTLKQHYDERIIGNLQEVADFYGYKPGVGSLLVARH